MKFVVLGAQGRMGKEVCSLLKERDSVCQIDRNKKTKLPVDVDAIIDFSTCENRKEYVDFAKKNKVPFACFSTGICVEDKNLMQELSQVVPVLLCSNASVGMQTMFKMIKVASNNIKDAEIVVLEYHHKNKKDSPSGTAKQLLKMLEKEADVQCFRVGNEVGTHIIQIFLEDEVLEISHRANSKRAFAIGAIEMTKKLTKCQAGFYENI